MQWKKIARRSMATGILALSAGPFIYRDQVERRNPELKGRIGALEAFQHFGRFLRTAYFGACTFAEYKWLAKSNEEAHQKTADRMLWLAQENRGLYIKAGQVISSMNYMLPAAYTQTLAACQDQMPHNPFSQAETVYRETTGRELTQDFVELSNEPVASASIAAVFRGKQLLPDGQTRPVAIKIQHANLDKILLSDLFTIETVFDAMSFAFPTMDLKWLMPEFKSILVKEMNFELEAFNGMRTRTLLANFGHDQLYVPEVYEASQRHLIMEWIDGTKITDLETIDQKLRFDRRELGKLILNLFAEQSYVYGFVHSDPHAGNLLVRALPDGRPQVVLLDHGLYRDLNPQFRKGYCLLWKSLVLQDREGLARAAGLLGVEQQADVLAMAVTNRPLLGGYVDLGAGDNRETLRRMHRQLRKMGREAMRDMFLKVDHQLMLVMRTNNLVRSLLISLGMNNEIDRFRLFARAAIKGYHQDPMADRPKYFSASYVYDRVGFELRLPLVSLFFWWNPPKEIVLEKNNDISNARQHHQAETDTHDDDNH